MKTFSIELTKSYDIDAWHEDIKKFLRSAGGQANPTVFLFNDVQIKFDTMVEDLNNLLNNADVPNLWIPEDKAVI